MEHILSLARKVADEAEVYLVSSEVTPVRFEANRLKQLQSGQSTEVVLRIIKGGRIGLAATTDLEDRQKLVEMAVETSQFSASASFELPSLASYPRVEVFDPEVEKVSVDHMVELGQSAIDRVRGHTSELTCDAGVTKGTTSVRILNSRGGQAGYTRSFFALDIEGILVKGEDMLFVGESELSCHPIAGVEGVVPEVIRQLELARVQAQTPTKPLPTIFTPNGIASSLIIPLAVAFNGKAVVQGASPLRGKLGEQVFDHHLSLWDDATIPYQPRSRCCDDEGVPSQHTSLVERGIVSNFVYDLQTAGLAGVRSTGNSTRSSSGGSTPSISNLVIDKGDISFDNMVRNMKEGLVVERLMGAGQGNLYGGEFSGNVLLGYKVERGEFVGRVKDTMVSGNIYQLLRNIEAIGDEARWVDGWLQTPSLYVSQIAVASSK